MNISPMRNVFLALLCGSALAMSGGVAQADDDRGHRGKAWGHSKHDRKHHARKHGHRHWGKHTVYRERVIVREAPRYVRAPRPVVHKHYYSSPRPYAHSRDPAILIGVHIPPVVIPLR